MRYIVTSLISTMSQTELRFVKILLKIKIIRSQHYWTFQHELKHLSLNLPNPDYFICTIYTDSTAPQPILPFVLF